jgi:hypothetical protein
MRKIVLVLLMLLFMILAMLQNLRPCPGNGNSHEPAAGAKAVQTGLAEKLAIPNKKLNKPAAIFLAEKDGPK